MKLNRELSQQKADWKLSASRWTIALDTEDFGIVLL